MASITSATNIVNTRYAIALLELAEKSKAVEKVEKDFAELQAMLADSQDLREFVKSPVISKDKKAAVVQDLTKKAKFDKLTVSFLGVLVENSRLPHLPGIIGAYQVALREKRGEVVAKVESAFALTDKQTKELQANISKAMGSNVMLEVKVDKELLGGMIVTVGSKMIDDSVRRKLERLERAMKLGAEEVKQVG